MARIIYSAIVENIRGSIAGTTFQGNKHGYTVKKKPNIVNPRTNSQALRKAGLSAATRAWRDLSTADRNSYNSYASTYPQYAKHNPSSQLSGYEVFVKWQALRFVLSGNIADTPSFTQPAADSITYALKRDGAAFEITVSGSDGSGDWILAFFMSRPFTVSQNFIGSRTRYISNEDNTNGDKTVTSQYTSVFGSVPSVGDRVALDVTLIGLAAPVVLARDSQIYTVA